LRRSTNEPEGTCSCYVLRYRTIRHRSCAEPNYGAGGDLNIAVNALASTANFFKAHGWRAGAGYQPGEANFGAIQAWNAVSVYQQAIGLIGRQIDGGVRPSARR
jgi:membrane-bound lytic murein transglycosylase B